MLVERICLSYRQNKIQTVQTLQFYPNVKRMIYNILFKNFFQKKHKTYKEQITNYL